MRRLLFITLLGMGCTTPRPTPCELISGEALRGRPGAGLSGERIVDGRVLAPILSARSELRDRISGQPDVFLYDTPEGHFVLFLGDSGASWVAVPTEQTVDGSP